jgi:hypothetical protein
MGRYAILGNHDYWSGAQLWRSVFRAAFDSDDLSSPGHDTLLNTLGGAA